MRHLTFLVVWTALMSLSLELQMTEHEMKKMTGKFCGSHLSDMLSLICGGVYNNKQKRNMYRDEISYRDDYKDFEPFEYSDEPLPFPFRNRQRAKSILPVEFRKRAHGVANECCQKSCSLWEMRGYCADQ